MTDTDQITATTTTPGSADTESDLEYFGRLGRVAENGKIEEIDATVGLRVRTFLRIVRSQDDLNARAAIADVFNGYLDKVLASLCTASERDELIRSHINGSQGNELGTEDTQFLRGVRAVANRAGITEQSLRRWVIETLDSIAQRSHPMWVTAAISRVAAEQPGYVANQDGLRVVEFVYNELISRAGFGPDNTLTDRQWDALRLVFTDPDSRELVLNGVPADTTGTTTGTPAALQTGSARSDRDYRRLEQQNATLQGAIAGKDAEIAELNRRLGVQQDLVRTRDRQLRERDDNVAQQLGLIKVLEDAFLSVNRAVDQATTEIIQLRTPQLSDAAKQYVLGVPPDNTN